ncbi:hypothetical protein [Pleionea sediminis]|uniref:DUF7931 domain-containing protein n=1 Tax=Pleionea sediminis TaxID=2569479 RepID=UPI001186748A|nr:hypothetical protein [Pleionea sediminis]
MSEELENTLLNAELGETETPLHLDRSSELKLACYRMYSLAKKRIDILTYDLEPRILSEREIEQALKEFIRQSRHTEVRILVFDTTMLQKVDHRLVALAQAFPSYVSIRVLAKDFQQIPYSFHLVDDSGLIYRTNHSELESLVSFNSKLKVREYRKEFNEMWEHSRVASELRSLSI